MPWRCLFPKAACAPILEYFFNATSGFKSIFADKMRLLLPLLPPGHLWNGPCQMSRPETVKTGGIIHCETSIGVVVD
jgi:hypothetical protein